MVNLLKNIDHWIVNYFNYTMIMGPAWVIAVLTISFSQVRIATPFGVLLIGLGLSVLPGYLLIPSFIYPDYSVQKWLHPTAIRYHAFNIVTLGFGPAIMYFLKWRSIIVNTMESKASN